MISNNTENCLYEISHNRVVLATFSAWLFAQILKIFLGLIKVKKFDFRWLARSGGMPSSHVALSMCMATSLGLYHGFSSGLFALSFAFAAITMFDAQGVRYHSGKQAQILNKIVEDIYEHKGLQEKRLMELVGHTHLEVYAGGLLGILTAILFYKGAS